MAVFERIQTVTEQLDIAKLPIGTIIPFVQYPNIPIPKGWVVCDGSKILDKASPLYGQNTPNLVDKYIIGGTISGETNETGPDTEPTSDTVTILQGTGASVTLPTDTHTHAVNIPYYRVVFLLKVR